MNSKISLGHAVNAQDLFVTFKTRKLNTKQLDHPRRQAASVFLKSVELVMNDVIFNNVTFNMPKSSKNNTGYITLVKVSGKTFKKLYKLGKLPNLDFLATNFSAWIPSIIIDSKYKLPRKRFIWITKEVKQKVIENWNNGIMNIKSPCVKTIDDYYEELIKMHLEFHPSDVKKILLYGWRLLFNYNNYGCDIKLQRRKMLYFFGTLMSDKVRWYNYYVNKLQLKLMILHFKKTKHNKLHTYYFPQGKQGYDEYVKNKTPFKNIWMFNSYDCAYLNKVIPYAIFKINIGRYAGVRHFEQVINADDVELVEIVESRRLLDIIKKYSKNAK